MKENKKPKSCARCACFTADFHTHSGKCSKLGRIDSLIACASFVDYHEAKEGAKNKSQKHDSEKPMYNLLPPVAIDELARVLTFGVKKYEIDGWKNVENAEERYKAAALRHAFTMLSGELIDHESGLLHSAHLMANAAFLVEFQKGEVK